MITVNNLTKSYKNDVAVLKDITFKVEDGIFMVILGPSGSGKSTLLNVMSGLLKPTGGNVLYGERDITKFDSKRMSKFRRTEIGNVFQNYQLLSQLTVIENIKIGRSPKDKNLDIKTIANILQIGDILNEFPASMSGGQQQRVAIARAIVKKPGALFCDEATGALDEENSKNVIGLLRSIQKQLRMTVIFITHNNEIAKTADRVLTIKNGILVSDNYNPHPADVRQINWA